jgi:prevent-host-death family protein
LEGDYSQASLFVMNIPIKDAKELFEDLIRRAEAGEQVVVTRDGKPVAEITASKDSPAEPSKFGTLPRVGAFEGQIWIADDFDELGPAWDEYVK